MLGDAVGLQYISVCAGSKTSRRGLVAARMSGLPSQVNAAISLLAYDPLHRPPPQSGPSARLTEEELAEHFGNLSLSLEEI